jgi:hypothetical protein
MVVRILLAGYCEKDSEHYEYIKKTEDLHSNGRTQKGPRFSKVVRLEDFWSNWRISEEWFLFMTMDSKSHSHALTNI